MRRQDVLLRSLYRRLESNPALILEEVKKGNGSEIIAFHFRLPPHSRTRLMEILENFYLENLVLNPELAFKILRIITRLGGRVNSYVTFSSKKRGQQIDSFLLGSGLGPLFWSYMDALQEIQLADRILIILGAVSHDDIVGEWWPLLQARGFMNDLKTLFDTISSLVGELDEGVVVAIGDIDWALCLLPLHIIRQLAVECPTMFNYLVESSLKASIFPEYHRLPNLRLRKAVRDLDTANFEEILNLWLSDLGYSTYIPRDIAVADLDSEERDQVEDLLEDFGLHVAGASGLLKKQEISDTKASSEASAYVQEKDGNGNHHSTMLHLFHIFRSALKQRMGVDVNLSFSEIDQAQA